MKVKSGSTPARHLGFGCEPCERDEDGLVKFRLGPELSCQLKTVGTWHSDVDKCNLWQKVVSHAQCTGCVSGRSYFMALQLEQHANRFECIKIVIDE
jgi:hypothetical protein